MYSPENVNRVISILRLHEKQLLILIRVIKNSDYNYLIGQYEADLEDIRRSISGLTETFKET